MSNAPRRSAPQEYKMQGHGSRILEAGPVFLRVLDNGLSLKCAVEHCRHCASIPERHSVERAA